MDDFALAAFACFLLLAVLASPIALWLTFRWGRRVRALERTIRDLDGRVATLGRAEPAPPRAPEPAPLPVEPETVAPAAPEEPTLPAVPAQAPPEEHEEQVAARPAPPPPRPSPLEELRGRLRGVDWERWIGVRGAAVVGGVLLALAAILFFRHAFARGWITPPYRVGMGVMAGLACIAGGWRLRGRGYAVAPSALGRSEPCTDDAGRGAQGPSWGPCALSWRSCPIARTTPSRIATKSRRWRRQRPLSAPPDGESRTRCTTGSSPS